MAPPPGESDAGAPRSVRVMTLLGVLASTMRGAGSSPVSLCADSGYQCPVPTDPSARHGQDSPFSCSRVGPRPMTAYVSYAPAQEAPRHLPGRTACSWTRAGL